MKHRIELLHLSFSSRSRYYVSATYMYVCIYVDCIYHARTYAPVCMCMCVKLVCVLPEKPLIGSVFSSQGRIMIYNNKSLQNIEQASIVLPESAPARCIVPEQKHNVGNEWTIHSPGWLVPPSFVPICYVLVTHSPPVYYTTTASHHILSSSLCLCTHFNQPCAITNVGKSERHISLLIKSSQDQTCKQQKYCIV